VARPLAAVAAGARRLASGERGVQLPDEGSAEVRDVSVALGALDRALAASEGRQRDFLLSVSHELRTPLTTVKGYAEALADGVIGPEEARTVGMTLQAEAERLEQYVADLLALARLQSDGFSVDRTEVALDALLMTASRAWRARAAQARVHLVALADPVTVRTDPTRLRQVVDALVDNAMRVCAPDDTITLTCRPGSGGEGAGGVVEVRDTGPGLTAEDRAVAFEPGALHARYAGVRPGGHGLGLAIVHQLVGAMGGAIEVSATPGGGTTFSIALP
ncbi:MAG: HAMP domain-containing sensor histidine kinase, partial [Nocardioides sp.]|uniref:sensor histidine kinase n=1 Tax=Nocardioides sp. TaxID=35761 RepID=UPI0039E61217